MSKAAKQAGPAIQHNSDGTRQVLHEGTQTARDYYKRICNKCFQPIYGRAFHEVAGEVYHHPECTKAI